MLADNIRTLTDIEPFSLAIQRVEVISFQSRSVTE